MDTNSNISAEKKVVNVEILHFDELGYGPQGKHTRREWRKECLDNLLAGAVAFKAWQDGWKYSINKNSSKISFAAKLIYDDGSQSDVLGEEFEKKNPYALDFVGHLFAVALDANNSEFQQPALFVGTTYRGYADFSSVAFSWNADFSSATFNGAAYFNSATFSGHAVFDSATFWIAYFSSATFSGNAVFRSATFSGNADFSLTTFHRQCRFENAFDAEKKEWTKETIFAGIVDFENVVFKNVGHFERVRFENHTPAFRGCQIDSTRLEFSDDSYFPRNESSDDAIKNISFLKRLADEHGQTDQALNFNAMELRAKRLQIEPKPATWSFRIITWLYEIISDYGRSFVRPLLIYLGLVSITYILALLAAANNSPQDCKGELWRIFSDMRDNGWPSCLSAELPDDKFKLNGYRAAFEYTTYRAAGILDFSDNDKQTVAVSKRLFNADVEPTWMRFWGIFKAIASAALLFLAALGLRNKYRIK
jgi:Pentapeptide repeats (9 copies)